MDCVTPGVPSDDKDCNSLKQKKKKKKMNTIWAETMETMTQFVAPFAHPSCRARNPTPHALRPQEYSAHVDANIFWPLFAALLYIHSGLAWVVYFGGTALAAATTVEETWSIGLWIYAALVGFPYGSLFVLLGCYVVPNEIFRACPAMTVAIILVSL